MTRDDEAAPYGANQTTGGESDAAVIVSSGDAVAPKRATEGPWQCQHSYDLDGLCTIIGAIDGPDDGHWHYREVCRLNDELDHGELIANARLITAAPELLSALKTLLADVQDYEAWQRPCRAVDLARKAIALAENGFWQANFPAPPPPPMKSKE
jgi:hypothetical protein